MKFNKTIVALLAIFIVIMSAAVVSADETLPSEDTGYDGDLTPVTLDGGGPADDGGSEGADDEVQNDETGDDGTADNETDDGGSEGAEDGPEVTATADGNEEEVASDTPATDATASDNTTSNSVANNTQQTASNHATGNPIMVLLIVLAVLGIYPLRR